jgi:hypothetical protein
VLIALYNSYEYLYGADEVPPCHGVKGDGLLVEDEEEFLQPYIDSVESIRSTRAYNTMDRWMDGWMDSNSWRVK